MCYFRKNMHIIELLKGTNIMKIIKCYCPNCGAPTSIETDDMYRNYMFCTHCGSKILIDEDITSRIVDVGKLKEEEKIFIMFYNNCKLFITPFIIYII